MSSENNVQPQQPQQQQPHPVIRIAVVGDGFTGKTCLLIVYKDKEFNERYIPTVFDSYSMEIDIDAKTYRLILCDTAGQEEYDRLRPLSYNNIDVFIIVYSVDNRASYDNVYLKWIKEVRHHRPQAKILLAANKIDLRHQRPITLRDTRNEFLNFGDGLALKERTKADEFVECSAKDVASVNELFRSALLLAIAPNSNARRPSRLCYIL